VGAGARGLDRVVAVQRVGQREIDGLDVFALQGLPEFVVVIARRAVLPSQRVSAGGVGGNDGGQPRLSSRAREGREQRALDERPCADDGVADLLGHEPSPAVVFRGKGGKREAMDCLRNTSLRRAAHPRM